MYLSAHDKLQRPFQNCDRLLMWMMMLGKRRTFVDVHPGLRRSFGVDDAGVQPWEDLAHFEGPDAEWNHGCLQGVSGPAINGYGLPCNVACGVRCKKHDEIGEFVWPSDAPKWHAGRGRAADFVQ